MSQKPKKPKTDNIGKKEKKYCKMKLAEKVCKRNEKNETKGSYHVKPGEPHIGKVDANNSDFGFCIKTSVKGDNDTYNCK